MLLATGRANSAVTRACKSIMHSIVGGKFYLFIEIRVLQRGHDGAGSSTQLKS